MKITDKMIEAAAKAMYEADPLIEGGEYIDGFQVSPGGSLSWSQVIELDVAEEWREQARLALNAAALVSKPK